MINILNLGYVPLCAEWVYSDGDAIAAVAVSDQDSNKIYVYDGIGNSTPLHVFEKLHTKPIVVMKVSVTSYFDFSVFIKNFLYSITIFFHTLQYNSIYETCISVDKAGILEYWTGPKLEYRFPKCVSFDSKLDTDLFEFAKNKTYPCGLAISPDGRKFASLSSDRKVRIFHFYTGRLYRVFDESLQRYTELQQTAQSLPSMEYGRR